MLKKILLPAILTAAVCTASFAQKPKVSVDGSVIMSSAYLWRGDRVCGLHFCPDVALHIGGFTVEQYSYLALDGRYKEIDLDLSYALGPFSIHFADYYSRYSDNAVPENFFSWGKGSTNHIDEVSLTYDCPVIPLNVKWFTFVWGDWLPGQDGTPDKLSFSSYLELVTYHSFDKYGTISLNLGVSFLRGSYTNYTKPVMPVHVELAYDKAIEFEGWSIPLRAFVMLNPYRKTLEAGASVGFAF